MGTTDRGALAEAGASHSTGRQGMAKALAMLLLLLLLEPVLLEPRRSCLTIASLALVKMLSVTSKKRKL